MHGDPTGCSGSMLRTGWVVKMLTDEWPPELKSLRDEVLKRFLFPQRSDLLQEFENVKTSLPEKYLGLANNFETNISAVASTVSIPVVLAWTAAEQSSWQRIMSAERIRTVVMGAEPGESKAELEARRNKEALEKAQAAMKEFVDSSQGGQELVAHTSKFLLSILESNSLSVAAQELILQGCVLTWSVLEVLSRELFEAVLNSNPNRALAVVQEPVAKRRLQSKFTLDDLASFQFDVSSSVGSLISSQQDFSDLATIKAALFPALNSDPAVVAALSDSKLWLLCQQRHLIVHRRGAIDARYLEATGETAQVGSRLSVAPAQLESQIESVVAAACAMLGAAGKLDAPQGAAPSGPGSPDA